MYIFHWSIIATIFHRKNISPYVLIQLIVISLYVKILFYLTFFDFFTFRCTLFLFLIFSFWKLWIMVNTPCIDWGKLRKCMAWHGWCIKTAWTKLSHLWPRWIGILPYCDSFLYSDRIEHERMLRCHISQVIEYNNPLHLALDVIFNCQLIESKTGLEIVVQFIVLLKQFTIMISSIFDLAGIICPGLIRITWRPCLSYPGKGK